MENLMLVAIKMKRKGFYIIVDGGQIDSTFYMYGKFTNKIMPMESAGYIL